MKRISDERVIKTVFLFSLAMHFLFLGLPVSGLFTFEKPSQQEKELRVRIKIEKPPLLPKIDVVGEEKKLKQVVKKPEPPRLEPEPLPEEEKITEKPELKKEIPEEEIFEKEIKEIVLEEKNLQPPVSEYVQVIDPDDEAMLRYQDIIKQRIESCRRYPRWAKKQGFEGVACLTFAVLSNGQEKGVKIVHSSGFSILDNEAVSTVRRAGPFPPIPRELNSSCLKMEVAVVFRLK
ncbi:MAG: energy transducer TonB [Candidatus Omnitrophota bacterium]|nr:energy transducer TonB [Candidatus Omnitrophota bacterium]